jgi:nicotinamidase/pyrazinamidase
VANTTALILVDLQNDFLPTGALPVPDGDAVLPIAQQLIPRFPLVVATQDWHPADHGSFAAQHPGKSPGELIDLHGLTQVLWPVHCVQNTPGAEFAPGIDPAQIHKIFPKGTDPTIDSYSGFYDNGHRRATGLGAYLLEQGITEVYVLGLATDYCVKFTALDALHEGLVTHVITDACRGVNLAPGDVNRALDDLKAAGAHLTTSDAVLAAL